jgi:hypothetical protein
VNMQTAMDLNSFLVLGEGKPDDVTGGLSHWNTSSETASTEFKSSGDRVLRYSFIVYRRSPFSVMLIMQSWRGPIPPRRPRVQVIIPQSIDPCPRKAWPPRSHWSFRQSSSQNSSSSSWYFWRIASWHWTKNCHGHKRGYPVDMGCFIMLWIRGHRLPMDSRGQDKKYFSWT